MEVLPDLVAPEPVVVFCGMASTRSCKVREHYYASPGNNFWEMLQASGFTDRRLRPEEDEQVRGFGLGLTDLVRHDELSPATYDIEGLVAKVEAWRPEWLAFSSKTVAQAAARALGHRKPGLGEAGWDVAGAEVYVLPGSSGANRRAEYDGRPDRLSWWQDLAQLTGRAPVG
jgi:TDG/mug DNA glycosylase family protein